jgi:Flp pilus assembly protein TadD
MFLIFLILMLLLSACNPTPARRPEPPPLPYRLEPPPAPSVALPPPAVAKTPPAPVMPPEELRAMAAARPTLSAPQASAGPAASSQSRELLLRQAEGELAANNPSAAIATLERALRLEPRNGELWYRLGEAQLRRGSPTQAEQAALKAERLATDNALRRQSLELVATARLLQGNAEGAAAARAQAATY